MTDSRIAQMRALIVDCRTIAAEMQDEANNRVDARRFGATRSYLNSALSSLDWFDRVYPDERA